MTARNGLTPVRFALFVTLSLNLAFWTVTNKVYSKWEGVPPVPSERGAVALTLGDREFSFRVLALMVQNLGGMGVDVIPLKGYNYETLGQWFLLLHKLNPASDHMPMTAAYYFGGTQVPKDVAEVVRYLAVAGQIPVGEKWRWLAHAAYLAEHRMYDTPLALDLAYKLSRMSDTVTNMPQWARQMPAFILGNSGDKEAATRLMKNMLLTEKNAHPAEINFMQAYLIEQLGVTPQEVDNLMKMRGNPPVSP